MAAADYKTIDLLVLDVDGVLTDGRIILGPDGGETKVFNVRDGWGMRAWQRSGRTLAIITGRSSPAVAQRGDELGVEVVRQGAKRKLPVYRQVLAELGIPAERTAMMGDDLTDLPLMRASGLAIAPADAVDEVRQAADVVTERGGGAGCVRELIELILKTVGDWPAVTARYDDDETL